MDIQPDWALWRRSAVACLSDEPRDLPRDPISVPELDVSPLVMALERGGVRWILTGSTVLMTAGVNLVPGDLDVVPDLAPDNLTRLADVLEGLQAFPQPLEDWEHGLTVVEVRRWRPSPAVANLDHRFVTAFGILDVVPNLTGRYDGLLVDARRGTLCGVDVLAADLVPVLRRLRASSRPKDMDRWALAGHLLSDQE